MSLLETKAGKIGTTGRTVWSGLFDALPDLTNREQSIFADTEGNVCAEVVLSGTLAKEFAGSSLFTSETAKPARHSTLFDFEAMLH
jgi:hypothetical protein